MRKTFSYYDNLKEEEKKLKKFLNNFLNEEEKRNFISIIEEIIDYKILIREEEKSSFRYRD